MLTKDLYMENNKYVSLELMLEDMEKAPDLYRPTQFWEVGARNVADELRRDGVEQFRSKSSTLTFFVPTYGLGGLHRSQDETLSGLAKRLENDLPDARWRLALEQFFSGELQAFSDYRVYLATVEEKYPYVDRFSESDAGEPVEHFQFDGRFFSRSSLNYLLGLNFIKKYCDLSEVRNVLEIGGGFGTLGEILLGDERNHCFYIDVDIPPTSYVAGYYLQQVFGSQRIGVYDTLREEKRLEVEALRSRFNGVVLCPWQLPHLEGVIDLFVNFISFQEMEPAVVRNYLHHVDRLGAKFILMRNIREGKQKATDNDGLGVKEPIKGDDYDGFLPGYNLIATNIVPFGYKTVDGFHSELRLYKRR